MDLKELYSHVPYAAAPPNLSNPIILVTPSPLVYEAPVKYAYYPTPAPTHYCYTPVPHVQSPFSHYNTIVPNYLIPQQPVRYPVAETNYIQLDSSKSVSVSVLIFSLSSQVVKRKFDEICTDPNITFNPQTINLIPYSLWKSENITFGYLVSFHFRKRNSSNSKFPIKLFNALKITEHCPDLFPHIGVKWITDDVIWVDREAFACLIGVKTVEGGLFHQQGNFPSHGFVELSYEESQMLANSLNLGRIDLSVMRLVRHRTGLFRRGCTELDILRCQWKG